MRVANITAAFVTLILGIFMVWESTRMHAGFGGGLHPGVFPKLLGSGLLIISLIQIGSEMSSRFATSDTVAWPQGKGRSRVLMVFVALIIYLAVMEYIGFTPGTFGLVLFLIHLLSDFKWFIKLAAAVMTTSLCTLVFQHWLDLKLPVGFLGM